MNGNSLKPILSGFLFISLYLAVLQCEDRFSWFLIPSLPVDSYLLRVIKARPILPSVCLCLASAPFLLSKLGFLIAGERYQECGIPNPSRLLTNSYSFNWKTDRGYINVINPFQGILIVGGAGSGKTYGLIEEIICQSIKKGYSGFIYDFKYPELSRYTYGSAHLSCASIKLFQVNFSDMERSHRINPLHPANLPVSAFANEFATIILKNLKREWVNHADFWADNAIAYFKAIIWYLRKHIPQYCTLPHAVSLGLYEYPEVLKLLSKDNDCKFMISSLLTAYKEDASAQIAGCVSSLQTPLDRLNIPELFWVLTGNDCDLDLNNAEHPCMLCIGNNPILSDTLNPVISLIASVVMKKLNQKNRKKSIFLLDEAPTLYIPNLRDLPNTGRSNQVATVYCCQDYSQMDHMYGPEEARTLRASLGNQFIGMVNDVGTAEQVSRIFGKINRQVRSTNTSMSSAENGDTNYSSGSSFQILEKNLVEPDQVMTLPTGTFLGKTTGSKRPFFFAKPLISKAPINAEIPVFKEFKSLEPSLTLQSCIRLNFKKIHKEIESLFLLK